MKFWIGFAFGILTMSSLQVVFSFAQCFRKCTECNKRYFALKLGTNFIFCSKVCKLVNVHKYLVNSGATEEQAAEIVRISSF